MSVYRQGSDNSASCAVIANIAGYSSSNGLSPDLIQHINLTSASPSKLFIL